MKSTTRYTLAVCLASLAVTACGARDENTVADSEELVPGGPGVPVETLTMNVKKPCYFDISQQGAVDLIEDDWDKANRPNNPQEFNVFMGTATNGSGEGWFSNLPGKPIILATNDQNLLNQISVACLATDDNPNSQVTISAQVRSTKSTPNAFVSLTTPFTISYTTPN